MTNVLPKPTGELKINEEFSVILYRKLPNKFHRFVARILLGWIYTEVGEQDDNTGSD